MSERWASEPYQLLGTETKLEHVNHDHATNLMPGKHVVATDFDGGEGILVDLNTKKYYQLNETAMVVWKGLEKGKTMGEIVADITSSYEVAADKATSSVQRIVDNFQTYKLLGAQADDAEQRLDRQVRHSHGGALPATALGVPFGAQSLSHRGVERDDGGRRSRARPQLLHPARRNRFRRDDRHSPRSS